MDATGIKGKELGDIMGKIKKMLIAGDIKLEDDFVEVAKKLIKERIWKY